MGQQAKLQQATRLADGSEIPLGISGIYRGYDDGYFYAANDGTQERSEVQALRRKLATEKATVERDAGPIVANDNDPDIDEAVAASYGEQATTEPLIEKARARVALSRQSAIAERRLPQLILAIEKFQKGEPLSAEEQKLLSDVDGTFAAAGVAIDLKKVDVTRLTQAVDQATDDKRPSQGSNTHAADVTSPLIGGSTVALPAGGAALGGLRAAATTVGMLVQDAAVGTAALGAAALATLTGGFLVVMTGSVQGREEEETDLRRDLAVMAASRKRGQQNSMGGAANSQRDAALGDMVGEQGMQRGSQQNVLPVIPQREPTGRPINTGDRRATVQKLGSGRPLPQNQSPDPDANEKIAKSITTAATAAVAAKGARDSDNIRPPKAGVSPSSDIQNSAGVSTQEVPAVPEIFNPESQDEADFQNDFAAALRSGQLPEIWLDGKLLTAPNPHGFLGSPGVQKLDEETAKAIKDALEKCRNVTNVQTVGGGGRLMKQYYIGDLDSPRTRNSVKLDITTKFNHGEYTCLYHINSVTPNSSGAPTAVEADSIRRAHDNIRKIVARFAEAQNRGIKNAEEIQATGYSYDSLTKPADLSDKGINKAIRDFVTNVFSCARITRECRRTHSLNR